MLDAELMDQVGEDLRVVVLVAVIHDDAGQVGQDEHLEGVQAAIAGQVPRGRRLRHTNTSAVATGPDLRLPVARERRVLPHVSEDFGGELG